MKQLHLYGAKGGVGTTTVALLTGLALEREGHHTLVVDRTGGTDLWVGAGVPRPAEDLEAPHKVTERLSFVSEVVPAAHQGFDAIVYDHGTVPPSSEDFGARVLVTTCCYLALRRAPVIDFRPDGVAVVVEPNRAITTKDVANVLGQMVVAEFQWDPAVARAIDGGLLLARMPRGAKQSAEKLLASVPTGVAA